MADTLRPALWAPDEQTAVRSAISRFAAEAGIGAGTGSDHYRRLWGWSVSDLAGFWSAVWRYNDLDRRYGQPSSVLADETMPGAHWFPDIEINIADYILSRGDTHEVAVVGVTELGESSSLTWERLRAQVAGLSRSLRELGVRPGDRVVGYLPNIPESIVAFLATASLGAVWSSVGQDYTAQAVLDRVGQLEPTVLIATTGYTYAGRRHDRTWEIGLIRDGLPTLRHTVIVPREDDEVPVGDHHDWRHLVDRTAEPDHRMVAFDHPLWVLFSSGTTGLPKGIVHGHGGILLEQLKFLRLHLDLGPGDRFFWYTSPSWVMWNIQACALATGATIVCYDGSPTHPGPQRLWEVVAEHSVSVFGSSPGYLEASRKAGLDVTAPAVRALRMLATSGAPIAPVTHEWATTATGGLPLFSISGGTDVASAFCGGSPTVEIRPGEIPVRCLGVAMDAWDESRNSVHNGVGELVVTRPMPSMPLALWHDESGKRYADTYFDMYPGVWRHGDWITITERGSVIVHGRSDSTLNRNGVRMGSADIYHALEMVPAVSDALVLGVEESRARYWMPLFVVLAGGRSLDDALRAEIVGAIKEHTSPRHVPDEIIQVSGLPHTRTGKRLEVPIKRLFQRRDATGLIQAASVDAPELLDQFVRLAEARRARDASPST